MLYKSQASLLLVLHIFTTVIYAQVSNQASLYFQDATPVYGVRKVDEYFILKWRDEQARLDNFAIELLNNPSHKGYIIAYGEPICRPGQAQARADRAKSYLVKTRRIEPERLKTVDGGYHDRTSIELYAVPEGAIPPVANPTADQCKNVRHPSKNSNRRQNTSGSERPSPRL